MKREIAAEIVDSLKEAGVDFVATLTEERHAESGLNE
jgi:hypothetical protein